MLATKFTVKPHSYNLTFLYLHRLFSKPVTISLLPSSSAASASAVAFCSSSDGALPYGPSLHKGIKPFQHLHSPFTSNSPQRGSPEDSNDCLDEESFTRVFDIAALRVPSEHCFALESRLRGYLLNWPRIRNIARVPGDEIEDEFKDIIEASSRKDERESLVALERRIYGKAAGDGGTLSPVLYRDKLAKTFNSKGYIRFRNLAKMTRPKRKRKKEGEEEKRGERGVGRNEMVLVEVVEESEGDDLRGLLGDEFRGGRWRGSTRLLLLDERYANKGMREMPEAIKAALKGNDTSPMELVKCKLTLFYSYWQMNEVLEALLPKDMIIPSAFETIGHIVHLNLRDEHLPYKKLIAKVVLDKNKPRIQTVVNKIDAIHNDYRTMQLDVLAGNHSLVTTTVENGLRFHVDLATVYWNSRLATERQRLLSCFKHDDVVCDVFAGVGPIAVPAAKKVKCVYANDLNPHAVEYLERNCVQNKLERKIKVYNMDGRRFIDNMFAHLEGQSITQVVMNLPNDAAEFLDVFVGIFDRNHKDRGRTLPRIHVYGFSKAEDPEFDFHKRIRIALSEASFEVEMRRVRLVAPGKWMLCASFILPERVAYATPKLIL